MTFRWIEPEPVNISEEIRENYAYSILLAEMLSKRGIATIEQASAFLDPDRYHSPSPFSFPEMEKAIFRVNSALHAQENIGIWGDFDADGQTATALLVAALRKIGGKVIYRVPVRAYESHGIQASHLKKFIEENSINLLITCDTGISEVEALELAIQMRCDVILTDHHTPTGFLPPAYATINPKLLDSDHPFYHLAGVGTAYQVMRAFFESRGQKDGDEIFLDLVALGTIADLAELNPENRFLVQKGISCLNRKSRPALQSILELVGMSDRPIDESMISFVIAPRLNAAGRLADANVVIEFLLSENTARINEIAHHLEDLNFERKMHVDAVIDAALKMLQENRQLLESPVIVLAKENWEKGVVGIAASHIVEEFHKPAILLSISDGLASGSARSIEGVSIIEAIHQNDHLLHSYGGHPMAAGLSLDAKDVDAFRNEISKTIADTNQTLPGEKVLHIDAVIPLSGISDHLAAEISQLSPFGAGNPAPVLVSRDLMIFKSITIGQKAEHRKLVICDHEGLKREAIWWRGANKPMPKENEDQFDLAYHIQPVYRNGQVIPQIEWLDYREASAETIAVARVHRQIEISDHRFDLKDGDLSFLPSMNANAQVWGESLHTPIGDRVKNRFQLAKGNELVILTAPPSQSILFNIVDQVMPMRITFMDLPGSKDTLMVFTRQLMGLVKYCVNHKGGIADIKEIACALCQEESTIRTSIEWLHSQGKLLIKNRSSGFYEIVMSNQQSSNKESDLRKKLQKLLSETAAFRSFYRRCSPSQLLPPA